MKKREGKKTKEIKMNTSSVISGRKPSSLTHMYIIGLPEVVKRMVGPKKNEQIIAEKNHIINSQIQETQKTLRSKKQRKQYHDTSKSSCYKTMIKRKS